MDIKSLIKNYEEEALFLLSKLISFKSVLDEFDPKSKSPFGKENEHALKYILEVAENDGFKVFNDDNYAGHIEFGSGDETLGILAHLDVVPVDIKDWNTDPFTLTIKDGKMYARGSVDDKGPLAATYIAMKLLKDNGFVPKKQVRLIMGCDEESGSRCLAHYFKTQKLPQLGFSPDAEFPLIYGEKAHMTYDFVGKLASDEIIIDFTCGQRYNIVPATASMKLSINLEKEYLEFLKDNNYQGVYENGNYIAYGVASHAMVPQNGLNASFILFEFLNKYHPSVLSKFFVKYLTFDPFGKKIGYDIYTEEMKELTSNVGVVQIHNGDIKIGVDCRVPSVSHENKMRDAIAKAAFEFGLTPVVHHFGGFHFVDPKGNLVQTLMNVYQDVTKDYETKPMTIGGGTYAKFIDNAVAYGPLVPGREDVCHIANEYMYYDDFIQAIEIYAKAIYELTK